MASNRLSIKGIKGAADNEIPTITGLHIKVIAK